MPAGRTPGKLRRVQVYFSFLKIEELSDCTRRLYERKLLINASDPVVKGILQKNLHHC